MQTKEYPEQIRVMYSVWTRKVRRDGEFYPVLAGTFLSAQDAAIKATAIGGEIRKMEV
jgi:hypothetical protein